jgi:hypothetical protein
MFGSEIKKKTSLIRNTDGKATHLLSEKFAKNPWIQGLIRIYREFWQHWPDRYPYLQIWRIIPGFWQHWPDIWRIGGESQNSDNFYVLLIQLLIEESITVLLSAKTTSSWYKKKLYKHLPVHEGIKRPCRYRHKISRNITYQYRYFLKLD